MKKITKGEILNKLRDIKFIGDFPLGIEVLLVPINTAVEEINYLLGTDFTNATFRTFLKSGDVFVFNNLEDWVKFKTPQKDKKR